MQRVVDKDRFFSQGEALIIVTDIIIGFPEIMGGHPDPFRYTQP